MYDEAPVRVRGGSILIQLTGGNAETGEYLQWHRLDDEGRRWSIRGTGEYRHLVEVELGPHKNLKVARQKATVTFTGEELTFAYDRRSETTIVSSTVVLQPNPFDGRTLVADVGRAAFTTVAWHQDDEPQAGMLA